MTTNSYRNFYFISIWSRRITLIYLKRITKVLVVFSCLSWVKKFQLCLFIGLSCLFYNGAHCRTIIVYQKTQVNYFGWWSSGEILSYPILQWDRLYNYNSLTKKKNTNKLFRFEMLKKGKKRKHTLTQTQVYNTRIMYGPYEKQVR